MSSMEDMYNLRTQKIDFINLKLVIKKISVLAPKIFIPEYI